MFELSAITETVYALTEEDAQGVSAYEGYVDGTYSIIEAA